MKNNSVQLGLKALLGIASFLTVLAASSAVIADEVWSSDYGQVIYQEDRGKTAIWTYGDRAHGSLFIEGLAGQFKSRGTYYGYWSQSTAKVRCETYREGRDGKSTYYWGNLRVQFLDPEFPSRWSASFGYCNQFPSLPWRAYPIVGNGLMQPLELP